MIGRASIPASPAHAEAMAAIHAVSFPANETWGTDAFSLQLALPGTFGLLHPDGGLILGRVVSDEAEILTLAVAPDKRRRGIAAALLRDAFEIAALRGATKFFLEVSECNIAARALYDRRGFCQIGRRRHYYADGADALVLRIDVPPRRA